MIGETENAGRMLSITCCDKLLTGGRCDMWKDHKCEPNIISVNAATQCPRFYSVSVTGRGVNS